MRAGSNQGAAAGQAIHGSNSDQPGASGNSGLMTSPANPHGRNVASGASAAVAAGRRLLLAGLALSLAGCTFQEATPALGVPTPAAFTNAKSKAARPLRADWARLFGSPELTRLADSTIAGNLDIAAAAARIVEAQAQAEIASSPQLPQLSGAGTAQRTFVNKSGGGTGNLFHLGLTASYEVDLWGRNAFTSEAAEHLVLADRFARDTVALSAVAAVVDEYFLILSAQDRIRIANSNAAAAREVLEAIKGRLAVGTVTQLEVAQQESVLDQQLATIPPFQLQAGQARTQIAILTGRTPEGSHVVGGSLDRLKAPVIPAGLPSQLLRRRPDVAAAEETLASADASVQAARAAFFPSLSLTGTGGLESTMLRNLLSPGALIGSIAAGVAQPIFDGYALQGELDQARGLRREHLETYRKAIVQALVDVENALIAIRYDLEHERRLADVVRSAQQAYDIERERLKVGTIDITTVLQTQLTLFGAQDALAVARLARYQAMASLAQALGGGWTDPRKGPVEPAIAFPAPLTHGLPGQAIVPPNEAATETHALIGQPPIPNGGSADVPGLGATQRKR